MGFIVWSGRALACAALLFLSAAPATASIQDLHVAVWGLDGAQVSDAAVGFESEAGTCKGGALPDHCYHVGNQAAKGTLVVEHPSLGRVRFEVRLPEKQLIGVDVIFLAPDVADLVLDPPMKAARGVQGFNVGAPANDLCENAVPLPTPVPSTSVVALGTTVGATLDADFPFCGTAINTPGVWYRVVGGDMPLVATTCNGGSDFDTKISVYCGSCEIPTCVSGNDDDCSSGGSDLSSTVTWCPQPGAEYLILVHGFGGATGEFQLDLHALDQPCLPEVQCLPRGACCLPSGECTDELTEEQCLAANGYYQGDGVACDGGFREYQLFDVGDTFLDISDTGTSITLGDDDFEEVPIGFEFPFFGEPITHVKISSNGYLTTGGDADVFSNAPCFTPDAPNSAIFGLWDDFDPSAGGSISYETVGPPGSRVFFVQWTDMPEFGEPGTAATFQIALAEFDGFIFLTYHELTGVPSFPGDATSGIEDATGLAGICIDEGMIVPGRSWGLLPIYQEPVFCPCRFVDFSHEDDFTTSLANGQDLTSPPEFGALFELEGGGSGTLGAAIFDSDPAGPNALGPDPDLLVDLGNVLILQSAAHPAQSVPGFFDVPDDNSTGGYLTFDFVTSVEPRRVDLVDLCIGDFHTQLFLWDAWGNSRTFLVPGGWTTDLADEGPPGYGTLRLDTLAPQPGAHGTVATASDFGPFDPLNVVFLEVFLGNSGALDNLEFCYQEFHD